jgi:hypothetical protein
VREAILPKAMKRQRSVEEVLPLDCWGMILLQLTSVTDVLNLSVQCKAFYHGLEPAILLWLTPRYHHQMKQMISALRLLKIEKVHKVLYMYHLELLSRRFQSCAAHADPCTKIIDCWYVDPIKRSVVPLCNMNPMRVVLNHALISMTRDKLKKERPLSWRVLDMILDQKRTGWKNIVFDWMGDQICKQKWEPDDELENLMLGDQLLCQLGQVSSRCITTIGNSDEESIISAYKSHICFTGARKLFVKHCLEPKAGE